MILPLITTLMAAVNGIRSLGRTDLRVRSLWGQFAVGEGGHQLGSMIYSNES